MDHFTNLLVDYIYTREFQENQYDYYASAVKKMHDIREKQLDEGIIKCTETPKSMVKGLFKRSK